GDGLRGGLRRRPVVAAQPRQPLIEPSEDGRGRGEDREERLLDDLLAGYLLGLFEEDVWDARRVRGVIEAAAALRGEVLEERVRAAARTDRRERDPGRLHPLEDLVVLPGARPAVGQQDNVASGRGRGLERVDRLLEPREDVGLPDRVDTGDLALQVADLAKRLGLDDPVRLLIERHDADLVALGQRRGRPQDGLLADIDLAHTADAGPAPLTAVERVAVTGIHGARLVDDHDERDVGLLLPVAHAHIDRQRLLERGPLVATGTVRIGSADHHEALADVADVDLERTELPVGKPGPRYVDQHDAVVVREL